MVADRVRGTLNPGASRRKPRKGVAVSDDQRQRLVEACAFFRAERFRDADPGQCRASDRTAAEADINSVIAPPPRRQKRRP